MLLMAFGCPAQAEIPTGYYDRATGKASSDLKSALSAIILPHTRVSSYSALPEYFAVTDVYPNSKRWWDMYSNVTLYAPSFSGLNREHSFPKSWWGGSTSVAVYTDLFHLYPSEIQANTAKSNYPLGVVKGNPKFDNGVCRVGVGVESGGAQYVFEPSDEYKGDFARTYFYVVTAYQDMSWKYTYMAKQGTYPSLQQWAIDMLLEWHRMDPVSEKEKNRNEAVYGFQKNRNPFIDYPELAEYIWGDKVGQTFMPGQGGQDPVGSPELISPAAGTTLDFGETTVDVMTTSSLLLQGHDLTGLLELSITGVDRAMFQIEESTVSAENVNSPTGVWVRVSYIPTSVGTHTAKLIIQDGGMDGSRVVDLIGEAYAKPVVQIPTALEPGQLSPDGYEARWSMPDGASVDYYMLTVTRYLLDGSTTTIVIPCEDTWCLVEGLDKSDHETYYVQAVYRNVQSERSNVITVSNPSGIDGMSNDEPLRLEVLDGVVRIRCGQPQSNLRFYDIAGRMVHQVAIAEDGMMLTLPSGVLVAVSDSHRTPVRVVVP